MFRILIILVLILGSFAHVKPRVVIVSMGGTIDSKGDTRLDVSNYGGVGNRMGSDAWLAEVPKVQDLANVVVEDLRLPEDTTCGMTFERLVIVARCLQEPADDPSVDGVVVTHGTNTLSEIKRILITTEASSPHSHTHYL
jgi:L-asparaginase